MQHGRHNMVLLYCCPVLSMKSLKVQSDSFSWMVIEYCCTDTGIFLNDSSDNAMWLKVGWCLNDCLAKWKIWTEIVNIESSTWCFIDIHFRSQEKMAYSNGLTACFVSYNEKWYETWIILLGLWHTSGSLYRLYPDVSNSVRGTIVATV